MPEEAGENVKVSKCTQGSTNFEDSQIFSAISIILIASAKEMAVYND